MKAIWNDIVIAESDETVYLEGNHYFPIDSVKKEYLKPSDHHTTCFWKGEASYYDLVSNGQESRNAAWTYPEPSTLAAKIKDHIAFYPVVTVTR